MGPGLRDEAREALRDLLRREGRALRHAAADWVIEAAIDLRGQRPRAETEALIDQSFDAWEAFLLEGDYDPLQAFIAKVVRVRGGQGFHISTLQRGLLSFKKVVRARLDDTPAEIRLAIVDGLDEAYERVLFHVSDAFQREVVFEQAGLAARAERERAAQTAFLADIGHEVRTPLSSLLGFAQIIERNSGAAPPDEMAAYLLELKDNARGLLELVDNVVDLARLESGAVRTEPEDLDLWRLVRDVHRDVEKEADGQISALTLDLPAHLPRYARLDGGKLARALRCILRGAVQLSPGSGEVSLRVALARPGWLSVRVGDAGLESITQRRSWFLGLRQPSSHRGAGPGLAIAVASQLAKLMGGSLGISGEPGHYRWNLDLPVAPISEVTTTAEPEVPTAAPLKQVLVLSAPDTPQDVLRAVFEDAGILSTFLSNEDISAAARPDVVLADAGAGVAGISALSEQPNLRDVPVVVATASASEKRHDLLSAGAYEVLDKPLDIDELMGALLSAAARPPLASD